MPLPRILRLVRKYGPIAYLIIKIGDALVKLVNEVFFYSCRSKITNIGTN